MNLKNNSSVLTILFLLLFAPFFANSQITNENRMTKAIQLFDNGNFAEAEALLENILKEKPDDFMANYFYGACRTENNHFTSAELEALIKANREVSPIDINYYFGVQYHARENWERALKFYNKYKSKASLTDVQKQKTLEKIQQCYDKVNPYETYLIEENKEEIIALINPITTTTTKKTAISEPDGALENSEMGKEEIIIAPVSNAGESKELAVEEIEFQINNEFSYLYLSHFKTTEGKSFYDQGDAKQKDLENLSVQLDGLREKYNNAQTNDAKKLIGQEILSLENETYPLKKEVAQLLFQAKNEESEYWKNADSEEIKTFKAEVDRIENSKKNEIILDSTVYINPNILLNTNEIIPPLEESVEKDLIYKIQIGAYSRGLPNYIKKLFDKLSLIRKIENYTDKNGVVVYTTGNLANYDDALKMRNQVRQEGVEDAIVVPYFKGKRITLVEAKELEGTK